MEIKYLQKLKDYDSSSDNYYKLINESISLEEISQLENLYNGGKSFPKALQELLFLAGKFCFILDFRGNKTQQEIQQRAYQMLKEENLNIKRPFYVIDFGEDDFSYIYLDEINEDPILYCAYMSEDDDRGNFFSLKATLSEYINSELN